MLILLGLLAATVAAARDDPGDLITDRPDQTESAETVAPGYVQVEIGWSYSRDDEGDFRFESVSLPETLARIGLAEHFELRVGWDGLIFDELQGPSVEREADGVGDASLGFKWKLRSPNAGGPAIAVLAETSVPIGDDDFSTEEFDPSVRVSVAHELSDRLSLGWNVGMGLETADNSTLATAFYTVALGIGISDRTGAFVEFFGDIPTSAPGDPAHSFDGGFTWLLAPNVQLDAAVGVGLSDDATDVFGGIGVTVRLPR